ncbi:MAG: hypothetical protein EPO40_26590 [Myxococcaceae bacterium]|nr:MAG: hypothetical protein EPO40_26590 [Myxococcaceae bacterium]
MPIRTSIALALAAALSLGASTSAWAQRRSHPPRRPTPAAARPGSVAVAPPTVATTEATPQARPTLDLAEVIPVPVSAVDGMLRRMRVYLVIAPPGSTAFGIGALGQGRRIWAVLPSCRTTNPDDDREPCPVDRLTLEAVIRGNVNSGTPTFLGGVADARRVQSFVVEQSAPRVRLRVLGPGDRVRYEAVVEADRLADLQPPEGASSADGFTLDLTRYPAR